ncbi:uncharacterized protein LOC124336520 isoform X3 [Daphnia pulicaria]|uniref:uncharacterized protein LOC124336520 isoform X3 n=1 Tax=Daphnia pulicaria TaxID=35523 RepID=UPI001EEBFDDD|nr:uncharacterized protein LOC124336520 isoform X3 [Daphnia pulicaria]
MKTSLVILVLSAVVAAVVADGEYAPPAYEKKYDGYFQYANVPGPYEYEFGYNRGNAQHNRNHYEQSKDSRFRTKVKWNDAYSGYGEHYWEYNHADGYKAPAYEAPAYSAPAYSAPGYSENIPSFEPAPAASKQ